MDENPDAFLRAVRLGVAGYVLKSASSAELIEAVREVARGEAVCPLKFCKVLFQAIAVETGGAATNNLGAALTQRQRQLMSLVAKGLTNKEIAVSLNLSEFTVKNHIYRVMKQVDAQNRHEAVNLIGEGDPPNPRDRWQGLQPV
jgi:DNA-binding NarL/FixJ family response regulator